MLLALATVVPVSWPPYLVVAGWSVVPVIFIFALLATGVGVPKLNAWKETWPIMGFVVVCIIGGLVGVGSAAFIWSRFPTELVGAVEVKADDPVADGQTFVDENPGSAQSDDLDFYYFAFLSSAGKNNFQYADVTMTNRSPRKMHLQIWGQYYYWKDDGTPASLGVEAEWNPDGLKPHTGATVLDFDAWETKRGSLFLFLGDPDKRELRKWNLGLNENVYFHVFDSVTGKHVAFSASGYPENKAHWPLPSPHKMLALEFPKTDAFPAPNLPPLETLDLLARTQMFGYNGNRVSFSAVITNLSANPMKLKIDLLILHENKWRAFGGLLRTSKGKDAPKTSVADLGPGESVDGSVMFDLTEIGVSNAGNALSRSPKENLFEISDLASGKKVWCATNPGYPPGTDMRSFAIQPPSENPAL